MSFNARFREMQRLRYEYCAENADAGSSSTNSDPSAREGVLSCLSDQINSPMIVREAVDTEDISMSDLCTGAFALEVPVQVRVRAASISNAEAVLHNGSSHYHKALSENAEAILAFGVEYRTAAGLCCLIGEGPPMS